MNSVNDVAIEYGKRIEKLLEKLGAKGPAKGAGDLLDQVKHLLGPEDLRKVRWFLKLRNRVVHGKPMGMPMPSREEVLRAGEAAVAALEARLRARVERANPASQTPLARVLFWAGTLFARVIFLAGVIVLGLFLLGFLFLLGPKGLAFVGGVWILGIGVMAVILWLVNWLEGLSGPTSLPEDENASNRGR